MLGYEMQMNDERKQDRTTDKRKINGSNRF